MKRVRSNWAKRGMTLLEALLGTGLTMIVIAVGSNLMIRSIDDLRDQGMARQFRMVQTAADRFVRDNYDTLLTRTASGNTDTITLAADLVPRYLPRTFATGTGSGRTPFGDNYQIRVRQAANNVLELLVYAAPQATTSRRGLRARSVVGQIGSNAGVVQHFPDQNNTTLPLRVVGQGGNWAVDLNDFSLAPTVNQVASVQAYDNGTFLADYLQRTRNVANPDANAMFTTLDMNNNNINGAGAVNAVNLNRPTDVNGRTIAVTGTLSGTTTLADIGGTAGNLVIAAPTIRTRNTMEINGQTMQKGHAEIVTELTSKNCPTGNFLKRNPINMAGNRFDCNGQVVTPGTVIAYTEAACPTGWRPLAQSAGRAIVGAGAGPRPVNSAGVQLPSPIYGFGARGGTPAVNLSLYNMPPGLWVSDVASYSMVNLPGAGYSTAGTIRSVTGQGYQAMETMPPFVALTLCEKT